MRSLLAVLLLTTPALAAEWGSYANGRFGVAIDIPPGFVNDVPPPGNGDGLTFHDPARGAELLVWGGNLAVWDFREDAGQAVSGEKERGFAVTYETSRNLDLKAPSPAWYAYSGVGGGRIVYGKAQASCRGTQDVHFRIEYPEARKHEFDSIVARLAASLRTGPAADCGE